MSKNIINHYKNVIIYDLITNFHYKNILEIIKFKKIDLNIGFINANIEKKKIIYILGLLKLITNQQPIATKSKKNNIFLKIKKNSIVGCKITLRKKNMNNFIEKLMIFILPNLKNKKFNLKHKNILNFKINNIFMFIELKTEFLKFKDIPSIDVSIHCNSKNNIEFNKLLNFYYF